MTVTIVLLVLSWFALTRSVTPLSSAAALATAIAAVLAQRALFPDAPPLMQRLLTRPHHLAAFLGILLVRLVQSTLATCRIILFAHDEGRIVALPSRLDDPLGQFVLSHAITLTPSTISLLVEGDLHYIHWLGTPDRAGDWRSIKESLENRLLRLFGREDA